MPQTTPSTMVWHFVLLFFLCLFPGSTGECGYHYCQNMPLSHCSLHECTDANLWTLDLSSKQLSGSIPPSVGSMNMTLTNFDLSYNQLTGPIPSSLGSLSTVTSHFRLVANTLSGTIPPSLGSLNQLTNSFIVGGMSGITGKLPPSLGQLAPQFCFSVYETSCTGTIPSAFGSLTALGKPNGQGVPPAFSLNDNFLTGTLPPSLGSLSYNVAFHIENNQLTGPIPSSVCNVIKGDLQDCSMQHNCFECPLPHACDLTLNHTCRAFCRDGPGTCTPDHHPTTQPPHTTITTTLIPDQTNLLLAVTYSVSGMVCIVSVCAVLITFIHYRARTGCFRNVPRQGPAWPVQQQQIYQQQIIQQQQTQVRQLKPQPQLQQQVN